MSKRLLLNKIFVLIFLFFVSVIQVYGFSFVVVGDTRGGIYPSPVFEKIMKEVELLSPDFVIHLGDWVDYPNEEGWKEFLKIIKIGGVPFYLVIGNHEVTENWQLWYSLYQKMINKPLYYSFAYKNCYFIILCCYCKKDGKTIEGKIDKKQFKWLKNELKKANNFNFIFVFIHEPLYPSSVHKGESLDRYPQERDKLANLLKKYKNKLIVFCAHEHLFNKKIIDGLTQIITGGGGAPLSEGGFYHYLFVTVKDKKLKIAIIKPGNILSPN